MKRIIKNIFLCLMSFSLFCVTGCNTNTNSENVDKKTTEEKKEITTYKYEANFDSLNDEDLLRYVRDDVYSNVVESIPDGYYVDNVDTAYISQEYLDELEYNSKSNVFFGYSLKDIESVYKDQKYVFTLSDTGETIVQPFDSYDETFEKVAKNVAVGTGVILVCVTVSAATAGTGAPAISMIFAASAKTGTVMALSGGAIGATATGIVTGIQTGDVERSLKEAAVSGSEGFKMGAITGVVQGGASEAIALKGMTLNGLSMNEAAMIQKESKYPNNVIKQIHNMDEYNALKSADLKAKMVNGKTALIKENIDLNLVDEMGHTNLERMAEGYSPLDKNGHSYELHHIGQKNDATLAVLTREEHDSKFLHGFKEISEIDRKAFKKQRKQFWKTMAAMLG